ncbi:MAG: SpoIIE family protein phosphatase [Bacteroidia bacterium]|nr:SpoIIE family protein phosphatase [Bacteroidia bacterium]
MKADFRKYFAGRQRFFCLVFFLIAFLSYSQQYNFKIFSQDDGLPQSYVYALEQTQFGYMAVGTGDGLSFTGGGKFKTFTSKNGLAENFVTALENGANGDLWIGHFQKGVTLFSSNKFSVMPAYETSWGPVSQLYFFDGKIFVANRSEDLLCIENGKFSKLPLKISGGVRSFSSYGGNLFAATNEGLFTIDFGKEGISVLRVPACQNKKITALKNFGDSLLVAGSDEGEIFIYKLPMNFRNFVLPKIIQAVSKKEIRDFILDENLWAGTFGAGIEKFELNGENSPSGLISEKNGLKNAYINCLYKDFEGNKWVGTYGGGAYLLETENFQLYTKENGLASEQLFSVTGKDNLLYLGLANGLQIYDQANNVSLGFFDAKNGFVNDEVKCLALAADGKILIGTKSSGAFFYETEKRKFSKAPVASSDINSINPVNDSLIVFSTVDGIFFYNPLSKKISSITTLEGIPHNNVFQTFSEGSGRTWFAAHHSPLALISNDSITLYKDIPDFKSFSINSICGAGKGLIYFGTEGDGLYSYDPSTELRTGGKTFKRKTVEEGLLSNYIYGLLYDKKNNSIISTHKNGISILEINSGKIKRYGKSENLPAFENNINSFFQSPSGKIYFGTAQGLGVYDPNLQKTNTVPPLFHILSVTANNKKFSEQDSVISLSYDEFNFRFDFIGISFRNNEGIKYFYKMEGLQSEFKSTAEKFVEFPKIRDGEFVFTIYAENADGVKSKIISRTIIVIDKPVYKKAWFIILVCLVFGLCVFSFVRLRLKALEKANMILEQKVKEKTKEIEEDKKIIEDINKDLEHKNLEITSSIDYAKRIQTALLPKKQDIQQNLDSFIFYRPRDIVSGDFYWYTETESYYYFSVVDCTGHGVPGAFMSLIGSSYLDQIMVEKKEPLPSEILTALDFKVIDSLKQKNTDGKLKDGMDMAMCRIEKNHLNDSAGSKKVLFSGAGRPLYQVSNGVLTEVKASMFGIGGFMEGIQKKWKDTEVIALKGDWIYIFSDGFGDQFGGADFKRYSTKKLKNLFTFLAAHGPQDQYEFIRKELKEWKGEHEQMDDILVAGIRL